MGKPVVLRFLAAGDKEVSEAFERVGAQSEAMGEKLNKTGGKATAFAKKFTAALAVGVVAVAVVAIKRGDELNESQDQLAKSLENSGQSASGVNKKLAPLQKTMEKFGFTNAQVDDSISQFTRSGIKLKDAIKDEAIAADIAKAKHIDLGAATTLVAKASQGQIKGLKALAIDLPVAAGGALKLKTANEGLAKAHLGVKTAQDGVAVAINKGNALMDKAAHSGLTGIALAKAKSKAEDQAATLLEAAQDKVAVAQGKVKVAQGKVNDVAHAGDKIMGALASRMKGSAAESAKSLSGKTAALKAKFTDMTAHLGQKLIPIVLMLATKLGNLADFFGRNKAALVILIGVVGLFTAAMVTLSIIDTVKKLTEAWTKAQAALNAVMDANPVVLVALAVAAIGIALFVAYKKFGPFHDAVDKMWQILQAGYAWVKGNWPLLLAILTGPIGLAVLAIVKNWTKIKDGFTDVKTWIGARVGDVVGFFTGLPGRISHAVTGMFDGVKGAFKSALNWIIDKWNGLEFKFPKIKAFGVSVGGFTIGLPDIPHFANGALVSRPTAALIGEDGPEMVLPLSASRRSRARDLVEQSGIMRGARSAVQAVGGGSPITVQVSGVTDPLQAGMAAARAVAWKMKTRGD